MKPTKTKPTKPASKSPKKNHKRDPKRTLVARKKLYG